MDFGVQLLIALGITCVIGLPILFYRYNKYKKEGRSVKYLEFKVAIIVGLPIISTLVLLNKEISILTKLIMILAWVISGIAYAYFLTSARKTFRKIMGLHPEDEHT